MSRKSFLIVLRECRAACAAICKARSILDAGRAEVLEKAATVSATAGSRPTYLAYPDVGQHPSSYGGAVQYGGMPTVRCSQILPHAVPKSPILAVTYILVSQLM